MITDAGKYAPFSDIPQEECGVFGIYSNDEDLDLCRETLAALFALQHRGQQSAGIAINNGGKFKSHKDLGTVSEAMHKNSLDTLGNGKISVGHVCYSPFDNITRAAAQPLVMRYIKGSLALAHNGSITNLAELHRSLEQGGAIFQSNSNAELIAYVIASQRVVTHSIEQAVSSAVDQLHGAYSLVISSPNKLIGVRDKNGFRPLCIGKIKNSYILSSESCAFDSLGAEFIRDVRPGEIVVIDEKGLHSYCEHCADRQSVCVFEYIYIARPDSVVDGLSVHKFRKEAGAYLAKEHPVEADLVCGVPDSGITAALGYSEQSGIPFGIGLIKNKYIGRNFSSMGESQMERLLQIKINVLKATVKDKRIVIIDDSIIKGSTASHIVSLLREAGAKEIHMRISSPPFLHRCYFGTDIGDEQKLIANHLSADEICKEIGADSLGFLSLEGLREIAGNSHIGICDACFSGNYPADIPTEIYTDKFSQKIIKK